MRRRTMVGTGLGYQPALDGLRAVAVAAVVVFHGYANTAGHRFGSGGFLGVDLFFVLSGYLITSLLVIEYARAGRIGLRAFWLRRARRLLPALVVALLLVALYAAIDPAQRSGIRADAMFTLLYIQNWHEVWSHTTAQFTPLSHTWSLSIEEQWYLLWPVVLGLGLRQAKTQIKVLVAAVVGLAGVSAVLMALLYSRIDVSRVYYGTDTRAQALLVGAAIGLASRTTEPLTRRGTRYGAELAGWCAAVFLAYEILRGQGTDVFLYRGGFLLIAIATGLVIVAATRANGLLQRALSVRPLVALGLISYGVYLYHRILFALITSGRVGAHGLALFAVRVGCTLVFATLSYRYIERPIRDGTLALRRPRLVVPATIAVLVALIFVSTSGVSEAPPSTFVSPQTIALLERRRAATPPHSRRVLVVGESQAFMLQFRLNNTFDQLGISGLAFGIYGCGIGAGDVVVGTRLPQPRGCDQWPRTYREVVDAYQPDVSVLMIGDQEIFDRAIGGKVLRVGTAEWAKMLDGQLDVARAALTARGARLLLLTSPCSTAQVQGAALASAASDPVRRQDVNAVLRAYASASHGSVLLGDLASLLCPNGKPLRTQGGRAITSNGTGLTDDGAALVWRWIASQVQRAVPSR